MRCALSRVTTCPVSASRSAVLNCRVRNSSADEFRTLQFSTADLEALTGHVVTLESAQRMEYWNAPIHAQSGICVPLVSNDMPIGTVWFGFENELDPVQCQSALCEVIADRIVDYLTSRLMPHRACTMRHQATG